MSRATARIDTADALAFLKGLPAESVQCCVSSPPYYGLRDYGTGTWEGGDEGCDHLGLPMRTNNKPSNGGTFHGGASRATEPMGRECRKCGAVRIDSQIGLESTPAAFIARLVAVFAEVRRVLTKDGTAFVNLGDSYTAGGGSRNGSEDSGLKRNVKDEESRLRCVAENKVWRSGKVDGINSGVKPKDRLGIPHAFAFAMRDAGWYWRDEIIWSKPNPMPESVTDRCTKSHEMLFMFSKSARYYYHAEAIAERSVRAGDVPMGGRASGNEADRRVSFYRPENGMKPVPDFRNRRSVWTVTPEPYPGAHFAVMPTKLVEPCILAGSRPGDTVLDPFAGSGTVLAVAVEHGRNAIGCDLNPEYVKLAEERIARVVPSLFAATA